MMVPYAEAFYREDALERALLAATMTLEHASLLSGMQKFAASLPGASSISLFLLLHEIAHFAVDSDQPFAQPRIGDVRQSLTAQLHAVRGVSRRLEDGDALADLDVPFGPGSSPERQTMTAQTKAYLDQIAGDEQVVREASCDFVALDGLARLRLKDCWDQDRQTIIGLTYREFADTLLIALRACRLLMGQEFLLQTVGNIVRAEDPTHVQKSFSHQMMRFNIITNLALEVFDTAVGSIGFSTPYRAGDPAQGKDPVPLMKAGMRRLHDLSIERVFNPIEQIGLYHRDPELYGSGVREASMKHFGLQVPPPPEMQGVVEALIEQFPF